MLLPSNQTLLLLVLVLLLLWLFLRVQEPAARTVRRTPLTPAELARMSFDAARAGDVRAFRELFLLGDAARQVLGASAEPWLAACTPPNLTPDFQALVHAAGPGAHFVGGRADAENSCYVQVRTTAGATEEHLIGRFVRVGNALRLIEPASGPFAIAAS